MAVMVLLVLILLLLHPIILQKGLNAVLRILKREPLSISMPFHDVLWIFTVCVLSWVVGGIGFYFFVESLWSVPPKLFLFLTGALAISSSLGLLAFFAPSGLGVREGILVYLLSSVMPASVAVILSILTRLWMTFIEIGLIGVVYLVDRLKRDRGESEYVNP